MVYKAEVKDANGQSKLYVGAVEAAGKRDGIITSPHSNKKAIGIVPNLPGMCGN